MIFVSESSIYTSFESKLNKRQLGKPCGCKLMIKCSSSEVIVILMTIRPMATHQMTFGQMINRQMTFIQMTICRKNIF